MNSETFISFAKRLPICYYDIAVETFNDVTTRKIERTPKAIHFHLLNKIYFKSYIENWDLTDKSFNPREIISNTLSILQDMKLLEIPD